MQIHNNTLIAECSAYDFKEMLCICIIRIIFYHKGSDNMIISSVLTYKESLKSAKRTAVSVSSFGASLGFHATTNRTDADCTL